MRDFVVGTIVTICCLAIEVFLLCVGWNLSRSMFLWMPEMRVSEAAGVFLLMKIAGLQVRGPSRKSST